MRCLTDGHRSTKQNTVSSPSRYRLQYQLGWYSQYPTSSSTQPNDAGTPQSATLSKSITNHGDLLTSKLCIAFDNMSYMKDLFHKNGEAPFPEHTEQLAGDFSDFFISKIELIRAKLDSVDTTPIIEDTCDR